MRWFHVGTRSPLSPRYSPSSPPPPLLYQEAWLQEKLLLLLVREDAHQKTMASDRVEACGVGG